MSVQERPAYTVGAALNAARILRYLGSHEEPVRLTRIAGDLDLHASTCLNILRTLADEGLVHQQAAAKTYSLGLGVIELARRALRQGEDLAIVRPMMEKLARKHGVTTLMWRRRPDHFVLVAAATAGADLHIGADLGTRFPLLGGSLGRVLAGSGELDEASLRKRFGEVDWSSGIDFATYMAQAREAHARGWAVDKGDYHGAHAGLSAAVPTLDGTVERVLNVALFSAQFSEATLEAIGRDLVELAAAIGRGAAW